MKPNARHMNRLSGQRVFRPRRDVAALFHELESRVLLSGLSFTPDSTSPDVSLAAVSKTAQYLQTGSGAPTLQSSNPFSFESVVKETSANSVSSATFTPPGGSAQALSFDSGDGNQFNSENHFGTQSAMDGNYPNGTYHMQIVTADDGTRNVSFSLSGNQYPNAPQVSNASVNALEFGDVTQPITVTWNAMSNGTASDLVDFSISDNQGNDLFDSPDTGAGAINGTSTSIMIPAGTMVAGQQYEVDLEFHKIVATDTTDYPSASLVGGAYSSDTEFDFTTAGPPAAPTGLGATPLSGTSARLNWTLNSTNDTSVNVYQWNGAAWQAIANLAAGSTTDTINGLTPGASYAFDVSAANSLATVWSATDTSVTTPTAPAAPTAVMASAVSSTSVHVSWTLGDALDTSVNVYQWNGTSFQAVANLAAGSTSDTINSLSAGGTYLFDVAAVNSLGVTFAASYASVTTPSAGAAGLVFVANPQLNTISEYTTSGVLINASFISGLSNPTGLAISGSDLFVANKTGSIGEYTTSGTVVNAALIHGLIEPEGVAISGSDLFVVDFGTNAIDEFTTSGTLVALGLTSGLSGPQGIAVSGSDLFISCPGPGIVAEYTTSGALVNPLLLTGLPGPTAIAASGSDLFITQTTNNSTIGSIGEYTTSGATVNGSLVTGLVYPQGIAVYGSNLFVADTTTNTLGEYTTAGVPVNAALNTNLNSPFGVVVAAAPAPAAPAAPTAVSATPLSSTSVHITWTLNDNLDTSVDIKRWNGTTWINLSQLPAGTTTYTDTGLSASTVYIYDVVAINTTGATWATAYSAATSSPPQLPSAPTGLIATPLTTTSIKVSWTLNGATTAVDLKAWTGSTWIDATPMLPAGTTTFTVTNLTPNTRYFYDVVAINANGATWANNYATAVTFAAAPPAAATNLAATKVTTTVHLTWTLNGGGETAVFVAKWNGTTWQMIAQLPAGTTTYTDNSPKTGTNRYEVLTYNTYGWSPLASPFAFITFP